MNVQIAGLFVNNPTRAQLTLDVRLQIVMAYPSLNISQPRVTFPPPKCVPYLVADSELYFPLIFQFSSPLSRFPRSHSQHADEDASVENHGLPCVDVYCCLFQFHFTNVLNGVDTDVFNKLR